MGAFLLLSLVSGVIFGAIGASMGQRKRMGSTAGFWWGFFLGPIGLVIVAVGEPASTAQPGFPPPMPAGSGLHAPPPPPLLVGTPAQWAPDPTQRFEHRYWDGSRWTEHVARAGQQFADPL